MNKDQVIAALVGKGWTQDRFGHLHHEGKVQGTDVIRKYRLKMQKLSCRLEVQVKHDGGRSEWVRVGGCYWRDMAEPVGDKIKIGRYTF